ncbi:unnamed protein product, partial [Brassica oleracea]
MTACRSELKVVVATNINPKKVGGRLFVNATSGTHFYLDSETAACRYHVELSISDDKEVTNIVYREILEKFRT